MPDDSERSDQMGDLVAASDRDESDESDGPASQNGRAGFLDLEADEAESDDSGGGELADSCSDSDEPHSFPQFGRLPAELRRRIWESFCPDLTAESRVYAFLMLPDSRARSSWALCMRVWQGPHMDQQTKPARTMLAVHRESRELALKAFPDVLTLAHDVHIRFNAKQDVVYLQIDPFIARATHVAVQFAVPGFSEHIHNLAVEPRVCGGMGGRPSRFFATFDNLRTVYYVTEPQFHWPRHLRWCDSGQVKQYRMTTWEEEPGLGESGQYLYCWPDLDKHRSFAEKHIPRNRLAKDNEDYREIKRARDDGVDIWPMVEFHSDSVVQHPLGDGAEGLSLGSSEDDESSEPDESDESDEYESEGIDDSDISEAETDGSSDMVVLDDGSADQHEEANEEDDASAVSGDRATIDRAGDDHPGIAEFSSPDQSPDDRVSDDSESDQPAPRTSRFKRLRGRIVESDSDDESEGDPPRKRPRIGECRQHTPGDGDEVGKDKSDTRQKRQTRAVLDEEEDESETEWSGISSTDSDGESAAGATVPKPQSLAEKLRLFRHKAQAPSSDDEDDHGDDSPEDISGDDYDARDYADFQDDGEDNGISEGGDDDGQNGFIDDEYDEGEADDYNE